jgi:hypothetical protein
MRHFEYRIRCYPWLVIRFIAGAVDFSQTDGNAPKKRALLGPPILQVFDLYVAVGCVDGERRASAI